MDPTNKAHSDDLTVWEDEEICALTANALPPLSDFNTHRDSSQGNYQLAIGLSSSSSSSEPRGETRDYRFYSIPEIELLITAVSFHGRNWKEIMRLYFKDSGRTAMRLKEKWRDMLRDAEKQIDPTLKELYLSAKGVDALYARKYSRA